ncbi:MAG: aminotransferase class V-fold PLP-dependent enzyme, partial [Candidatus Hodarchaeota archaeon]
MSKKKRIYFDHTAGKPVDSRVVKAMVPNMKSLYGNPSSIHSFGKEASQFLEKAREKVAEFINA